jgi:hypothetical protein
MARGLYCAIHQPNLFPRIGTLAKLFASDVWIVLDDVQFARRDYQHRFRIARLDNARQWQWLSLSTHRPRGRETQIADVRLVNPRVEAKRLDRLVRQYYRRSPFWSDVAQAVDTTVATLAETDRLASVAETSTRALLDLLDWSGTIVRSSDFDVRSGRSQRLADLNVAVGAETYLCGRGGARYLDRQPFTGIAIKYIGLADKPENIWAGAAQISAMRAFANVGALELVRELRRFARTEAREAQHVAA